MRLDTPDFPVLLSKENQKTTESKKNEKLCQNFSSAS